MATAEATEFLHRYYKIFSTLDLDSIASFFHEPCVFISAQGVLTTPTQAVVKEVFGTIAQGLRAKRYGKSELAQLDIRALSEATTLATGVAVRYKLDGVLLERVGVTYILQKSEPGWRIAVTVLHDP